MTSSYIMEKSEKKMYKLLHLLLNFYISLIARHRFALKHNIWLMIKTRDRGFMDWWSLASLQTGCLKYQICTIQNQPMELKPCIIPRLDLPSVKVPTVLDYDMSNKLKESFAPVVSVD